MCYVILLVFTKRTRGTHLPEPGGGGGRGLVLGGGGGWRGPVLGGGGWRVLVLGGGGWRVLVLGGGGARPSVLAGGGGAGLTLAGGGGAAARGGGGAGPSLASSFSCLWQRFRTTSTREAILYPDARLGGMGLKWDSYDGGRSSLR